MVKRGSNSVTDFRGNTCFCLILSANVVFHVGQLSKTFGPCICENKSRLLVYFSYSDINY